MSEIYDDLLENVLHQYQKSCIQPAVVRQGDAFSDELYARIENRLSLSEQLLLHRALSDRDAALLAVRSGQLAMAGQLFTEARRVLSSSALSQEGKLLHQSLLYQSETYLDYCQGEFALVRSKTENALSIDIVLEDQYGYDLFHLHRIQLLHNLVRTDARCQNYDHALELASQILSYLEGQREALPIGTAWGFERMARQPIELVRMMIAQITSEIAVILAAQDFDKAYALFQVATCDPLERASIQCVPIDQHSREWLYLKQSFLSRDRSTFLKQTCSFLEIGRSQLSLLWYAVVVDLLRLCDELECPAAKRLQQAIVRDTLEQEQMIPFKFRSLLLASYQPVAV
ncbi:MAG: hypothetical protein KME43_09100 [Myxacorys chilensis ATA2-1-KO14]|jgi:hypothetical protein|nr:hypothetical protein [Myxacorys chilensis ATA2-1-KO14]